MIPKNTRFTLILTLFLASVIINMSSGLTLLYSFIETTFGSFRLNYFILDSPQYSVIRDNSAMLVTSTIDEVVFLLITVLLATWFFDLISSISIREKITRSKVKKAKEHVIVAPFNDLAKALLEELKQNKISAVFITENKGEMAELQANGVLALYGAIKSAEAFETAGIRRAAYVIACSDSDIQNALIAVTAKNANPNIKIISVVHEDTNIPKLSMVKPEISAGDMVADELLKRLV